MAVGWSPEGWKGETTSNSGMSLGGYPGGVTAYGRPAPSAAFSMAEAKRNAPEE